MSVHQTAKDSEDRPVDLTQHTVTKRQALWQTMVREIMFVTPCTVVWKCQTSLGNEVITFDHVDRVKLLTIGKLQIPADFLLVLSVLQSLVSNVDFQAVIMSLRPLKHPVLPEAEHDGHHYYYQFD